jgi:hypothetical protein
MWKLFIVEGGCELWTGVEAGTAFERKLLNLNDTPDWKVEPV